MFNYERRLVKMAELKSIEKSYIEDFLEMQSGYVLDFSNNKFERFIYDSINIEIYEGEGYNEYCSKANKIRHILNKESNLQVAKLLEDLVEYKSYNNKKRVEISGEEISVFDKNLEQKVIDIINRLTKNKEKKQVNQSTDLKGYDVFISHASEDKKPFVEELTHALKKAGIKTWYDVDQIGWGESIRQSIDRGLINSHFCIVVLSRDFFNKYWAGTYELNAIFQKAALVKNPLILPIWHNITIEEISQYNLTLPDIKALNSSRDTLDQIVSAMKLKLDMD